MMMFSESVTLIQSKWFASTKYGQNLFIGANQILTDLSLYFDDKEEFLLLCEVERLNSVLG